MNADSIEITGKTIQGIKRSGAILLACPVIEVNVEVISRTDEQIKAKVSRINNERTIVD